MEVTGHITVAFRAVRDLGLENLAITGLSLKFRTHLRGVQEQTLNGEGLLVTIITTGHFMSPGQQVAQPAVTISHFTQEKGHRPQPI